MTDTLVALRAERDALEAAGDYGSAAYEWLVERVAELERQEPAEPVAAPQPEATPQDRLADLAVRLQQMERNPAGYSDEQRRAAALELNELIREVRADADPEADDPEDVAVLGEQMRAALQRGHVDPAEAGDLVRRFNRAVRNQITGVTPASELQAALAGEDPANRFAAAGELARRGELDPAVAAELAGWLNQQVQAANEAGGIDLEWVPEGPARDLATRMQQQVAADEAAMRHRGDERDQLVAGLNELVRAAGDAAIQQERSDHEVAGRVGSEERS